MDKLCTTDRVPTSEGLELFMQQSFMAHLISIPRLANCVGHLFLIQVCPYKNLNGRNQSLVTCNICFKVFYSSTVFCTTIHRYPIFSMIYTVMCKVYTGYCGTSEIEHGLCACTVDNPRAKASSGIISPYRRTNHALSLTCTPTKYVEGCIQSRVKSNSIKLIFPHTSVVLEIIFSHFC